MSNYIIDSDIILPPKKAGGQNQLYPTQYLEVGQSYFVPTIDASYSSISAHISYIKKHYEKDRQFTCRKVAERYGEPDDMGVQPIVNGTRVWRTA